MAFLVFLTIVAVVFVSSSSEVMERDSFYSCCDESLDIKFSPRCDHIWSRNGTNIAWHSGEANECTSPCQVIEGGRMTLDSCTNVSVTTVCTDKKGVTTEERIHYRGQPCSGSVSHSMAPQGCVGVLPAVILALCTMQMIC